ncbi:MAG: hypothetical protein OXC30_05015 [Alphaproteobacteria bacterium]|nr:hypothetical protein [Alphaproteobacteria bacterium]
MIICVLLALQAHGASLQLDGEFGDFFRKMQIVILKKGSVDSFDFHESAEGCGVRNKDQREASQKPAGKGKMCRFLELWSAHLEQERSFGGHNPPFVSQEQLTSKQECCTYLKDSLYKFLQLDEVNPEIESLFGCANSKQENCAHLRDNLERFLQLEFEINDRIESLLGCANFFIQQNEDDSLLLKLSEQNAEWYKLWRRRLSALASRFIDEGGVLKQSRECRMQDLFSGHKCFLANDDDSVLPPTQVDCDANDLCSNLENFIEGLKEIQVLEAKQRNQKVYRSFLYVVLDVLFYLIYDPTAECALRDKLPETTELQYSLLEYFNHQDRRTCMIGENLHLFPEFLTVRKVRKLKDESIQREPCILNNIRAFYQFVIRIVTACMDDDPLLKQERRSDDQYFFCV